MKRMLLLGLLAGLATVNMGCLSRIAKEGFGAVAGGKANVVELTRLPKGMPLGPVTVDRVESGMDHVASSVWLTSLTDALRRRTAEEEHLRSAKHPVRVSGSVIHLEGSGIGGLVSGPDSEVVVRVTVTDGSGKVLGVANVVGRARSSTSSSQEDLCNAFARGVADWLKDAGKRD